MATIEQEQQSRESLQGVLAGISDFTSSASAISELPSDLSFQSGVMYFDRIIRLFKGLHDADLTDIPFNTLQNLNGLATAAFSILSEIRDFSITKYPNNPIAQRDSIMNRARDQYDGWFQAVAPVVAYTVRKGVDFERLENQARQCLRRLNRPHPAATRSLPRPLENPNRR